MKNRSKSPKRKLKFISIPTDHGTEYRVIKKSYMDHYYKDRGLSLKDFRNIFGIGHRLYRQSVKHWYTDEEQLFIRGSKISIAQKNKNSNRANYFKPRNLIEINKLKKIISVCKSQSELLDRLGISKYVLTSNLQFHGLTFKSNGAYKARKFEKINDNDIKILKSVAIINPEVAKMVISFNDPKLITNGLEELTNLSFEIRLLIRKLKNLSRSVVKGKKFVTNITEYLFKKELEKMGINYIPQFKIDNREFDFLLIDLGILIELDGPFHSVGVDKIKTAIAHRDGYRLIRIPIPKRKYKTKQMEQKFERCLNQIILKG